MAKQTYELVGWKNENEGNTPVSPTNLKHMDEAIKYLYDEGATSKDIFICGENQTIDDAPEEAKIIIDSKGNIGTAETSDSGWINPNLTEAFEVYSTTQPIVYRKIGNIVNIQGALKPKVSNNNLNSSNETVAFTLPSGFRPKVNTVVICQGSDTNIFCCIIKPNGDVALSRYRNGASYNTNAPGTNTWLSINVTFMVA